MTVILFILGLPAVAAILLPLAPSHKVGAKTNIGVCMATFCVSLALFFVDRPTDLLFFIDDFNIYLVVLTTFVGLTTSFFSAGYIAHEIEHKHLDVRNLRFYHAMFQAFMFTMLLGLVANNLGFLWVAVEGATLATALMISLSRTQASIKAAWKYFILCGVGIALALFGTILVYLAAQPVMGAGLHAMAWSELMRWGPQFDPVLLDLAFVFLLIGYGTKAGLAPLHAWLPDAHGEGPTPVSAVLSGLLLNVALYALLRFKMLLVANGKTLAPGPLMIGMGLMSLVLASVMLYRRRDIKRMFAYSSIEHIGLVTFAFGLGGAMANFAGLLHMMLHSLTKSAIFFIVGHVAHVKGTQNLADLRGLTVSHPPLGWTLVLAMVAIAGLPPLGLFTSEFLMVTTTVSQAPLLAAPLVLGLLVGFGALALRLQGLAFGTPRGLVHTGGGGSLVPIYAHLALVLVAGVYLPAPLVRWFEAVSRLLG
ncbi:MAG: hyfF [Rhodospirillaceae bacterium]|nr:MAG: hyfF [Rhodospirillaceae bacterium]